MQQVFVWYLLGANLAGFLFCGVDKWKAKRHAWRVSEKTLFGVTLLGGGFGMWCGMYLFRHKTKHWYFVLGIPAITVIEYGLMVWFYLNRGNIPF